MKLSPTIGCFTPMKCALFFDWTKFLIPTICYTCRHFDWQRQIYCRKAKQSYKTKTIETQTKIHKFDKIQMNKMFHFVLQGKIHSKHKCNTSCFWDLNSWLFQKMFCWISRHFKDWFCRKLSLLLDLVDVGNGLESWRWFVVSLITCACVLAATVQRPYHFSPS